MRIGIVRFPGSADQDVVYAVQRLSGATPVELSHRTSELEGIDAIVLPGGFSYGDYLRPGAIASTTPVIEPLKRFIESGAPVLGIGNGFQVLCEAGLLPGALLPNRSLRSTSRRVKVRVERSAAPFTSAYREGALLDLPVAHGKGCFFAADEVLEELEAEHRILFRYVDDSGEPTPEANPNGSANHIAGIINAAGNVLGMMPHPDRAVDPTIGSHDGLGIFESLLAATFGSRR